MAWAQRDQIEEDFRVAKYRMRRALANITMALALPPTGAAKRRNHYLRLATRNRAGAHALLRSALDTLHDESPCAITLTEVK